MSLCNNKKDLYMDYLRVWDPFRREMNVIHINDIYKHVNSPSQVIMRPVRPECSYKGDIFEGDVIGVWDDIRNKEWGSPYIGLISKYPKDDDLYRHLDGGICIIYLGEWGISSLAMDNESIKKRLSTNMMLLGNIYEDYDLEISVERRLKTKIRKINC